MWNLSFKSEKIMKSFRKRILITNYCLYGNSNFESENLFNKDNKNFDRDIFTQRKIK